MNPEQDTSLNVFFVSKELYGSLHIAASRIEDIQTDNRLQASNPSHPSTDLRITTAGNNEHLSPEVLSRARLNDTPDFIKPASHSSRQTSQADAVRREVTMADLTAYKSITE